MTEPGGDAAGPSAPGETLEHVGSAGEDGRSVPAAEVRPDRPRRQVPAWWRPGWRQDAVLVLGGYLVLALVAALAWWLVVDPAVFTKAENGGLAMGEVELAKRFNDDGWFAVIAAVLGLLSGAAAAWHRTRDPMLTAGLVLVGSAGAGVVMALVGGALGPGDPERLAASAPVGATLPMQLEVDSSVGYLVWPITALIGVLIVLWSPAPVPDSDPDDSPEPDAERR
jgi:hypothetical protein